MTVSKDAQKVIDRADKPTRVKLNRALERIARNECRIEPLKPLKKGMEDDLYRYKMEQYRIIFKKEPLTIKFIGTKNATTYHRTGCM